MFSIKPSQCRPIDLPSGETKVESAMVHYHLPGGVRFRGQLTVTNKRLLYDALFDPQSGKSLPAEMFIRWGSFGYLEFNFQNIKKFERNRKWMIKNLVFTLQDGSIHIFKNYSWKLNKLENAIHQFIT